MFDASHSKQLQLFRATMIISMASRVGNATVRDGREADAFVAYLRNATEEVNFLAAHVYDVDGKVRCREINDTVKGCDTHAALFESDLPQLEYKVVRLVLASLPQKQAASFARSVQGVNVLSSAYQALRLAATSLDGVHRGAAVYRSILEVEALMLASRGLCASGTSSSDVNTVNQSVACLGLSNDTLANPAGMPLLPKEVPSAAFDTLFGIVRTSCGMMPVNLDVDAVNETNTEAVAVLARQDACATLTFSPQLRFGGFNGVLGTSAAQRRKAVREKPPATMSPTGGAETP